MEDGQIVRQCRRMLNCIVDVSVKSWSMEEAEVVRFLILEPSVFSSDGENGLDIVTVIGVEIGAYYGKS